MHRSLFAVRARAILTVLTVSLAGVGVTAAAPARFSVQQGATIQGGDAAPRAATISTASISQTIVAVGDSITKGDWDSDVRGGWVTRLATKLRAAYQHAPFVVRNEGVDGDTTAGVLTRLTRDVIAARPGLVIISIGTNDFDDHVPPDHFAAQLRLVVQRLQALRNSPLLVLVSMLPIAAQTPRRLAAERAYNDIIRHIAARANVGYLDLFDHWLALGSALMRTLRHDAEHPNPIGYELLASTTAAYLQAAYLDAQGRLTAPADPPTCSPELCGP